MKRLISIFIIYFLIHNLNAQIKTPYIEKLDLISTSKNYSSENDYFNIDNERYFCFEFSNPVEEFIIRIYPYSDTVNSKITLLTSVDYDILDTVLFIDNLYYQTKIKFNKILDNPELSIKIGIAAENKDPIVSQIKLFSIAKMDGGFVKLPEEMFVGEESTFDLSLNIPDNVILTNSWNERYPLHTRIGKNKSNIAISVNATQTGKFIVPVFLSLKRPIRDTLGNLQYQYGPFMINLEVKSSRLAFLNSDIKEISVDENIRYNGIEIQIDNNRQLQLQKTYRIEDQEELGGALIAELFTKSRISNNKVICVLRVFNYHNPANGFLYIKDGDLPKFITNFSAIPLTEISKIKIMRQGKGWEETTTLYPGEELLLRLEGQSMNKAKFSVEDLVVTSGDTLENRSDIAELKLKIPLDIHKKSLNILIDNNISGKVLNIAEHQKFRHLDYIQIDYGKGEKNIVDYTGPEFTQKDIKDIIISFDHDQIDFDGLYGNQSFDLEVRILGSKSEILEVQNINRNIVSPGERSPRYNYYDKSKSITSININQYLNRKTYDLDSWVRIRLIFKPCDLEHVNITNTKTIDIIVQKAFRFDIDVSFPAGLLTKKLGEPGYGDLGGISLAMIAQFSFFQKDKIARYKPYKIGAGFIAINALNFADDVVRDMGIVILGSLYPTTKETKMTFPLYFGGGYLMASNKWFVLIGPGIRVRL
jgi:hypothetical protein